MCDNLNWMKNGWMDWIEWMWRVDSGAVPDLTLEMAFKPKLPDTTADMVITKCDAKQV